MHDFFFLSRIDGRRDWRQYQPSRPCRRHTTQVNFLMYLEPFVGFLILANGIMIGLQTDPQLFGKHERERLLRLLSPKLPGSWLTTSYPISKPCSPSPEITVLLLWGRATQAMAQTPHWIQQMSKTVYKCTIFSVFRLLMHRALDHEGMQIVATAAWLLIEICFTRFLLAGQDVRGLAALGLR